MAGGGGPNLCTKSNYSNSISLFELLYILLYSLEIQQENRKVAQIFKNINFDQ
jgi:hypothetical protein